MDVCECGTIQVDNQTKETVYDLELHETDGECRIWFLD